MNSAPEEIKSKLNIVDLIGEYVRLEKAGVNWKALCPFHNEKTPSFYVNEEKQFWHCFGCGKGGDAFAFLMEIENLDFKEALKILAERTGVDLSQYQINASQNNSKNKTLEILELATRFYEKQLWENAGGKKIQSYLVERGIKEETARAFRLGYAPAGWRNVLEFLSERGYSVENIMKSGLLVNKEISKSKYEINSRAENSNRYYDRFRDRIIFPITDVMGKIIGFSARVAPGGDESQAKYVNTPETEIYYKSRVLYGLDKAKNSIKEKNVAVLVEGNADVIACHQAGITNAIAVSGTALTSEQLDILRRWSNNLILFFDMDKAGQLAAEKSARMAFEKDFNVSIATTEKGKDAADLAKENPELLRKTILESVPATEYFFRRVFSRYNKNNIQEKKIIAEELLELISHFSNPIEKEHWAKQLARELDTDEKIFLDELRRFQNRSPFIQNEEKKPKFVAPVYSRAQVIRKEIIGLLLTCPVLWKEAAKNWRAEIEKYFPDSAAKKIILEKGDQADFDFEKILPYLSEAENFLEKIYFETKTASTWMNFSESGEEKEKIKDLLENYFLELKKEFIKEKMEKLTAVLREEEAKRDNEAISKTTQELIYWSRLLAETS